MKTSKTPRRAHPSRWRHFVLLACLATLVSLGAARLEWRWGAMLDDAAHDVGFGLRGAPSPAQIAREVPDFSRIVIVELPHDIPRPLLARLVLKLRLARATALDLMLNSRAGQLSADEKPLYARELKTWQAEDETLARAIQKAGNVVVGAWPERVQVPIADAPGQVEPRLVWAQPAPLFRRAARALAHLSVVPDAHDGLIRRVHLWEQAGEISARRSELAPTGASAEEIAAVTVSSVAIPSGLASPMASSPAPAALPSFGLCVAALERGVSPQKLAARLPVDRNGSMVIGYLGPREIFEGGANRIVFERVLNLCEESDFQNALVFVGQTDYRSKDVFPTPFGDLPGLLIHANIAATLLSESGPPRPLGWPLLSLLTFAAALLVVAPLLRFSLPICAPFVLAEMVALSLGVAAILARFNLLAPLSVPITAVFLTYNGVAIYEYIRARSTLRRVVGHEMVPRLLDALQNPALGGRETIATAFFCDLRGYSELSQQLAPAQLISLLNIYTEALVGVAQKFGGRPIDYFGDGVFVLFEGAHHARRGVEAALETQKVLRREFAALGELAREKEELAPLAHAHLRAGIALDTGAMVVGLVGARDHFKPGAVGDAINVASRVQGLTDSCSHSILITRRTLEAWEEDNGAPVATQALFCGLHLVKGRKKELEVFGIGQMHE